jgi:hypothetical protein
MAPLILATMTVSKSRRVKKGTRLTFAPSMGTNTEEHYVDEKLGKFTLQGLERHT